LHELSETQAIDDTIMDLIAASQHYAKRTNYTFKTVKTSIRLDCLTSLFILIVR
jgi:hypothetical protein